MAVAPIILFEEWGWEPLQRLVGKLARYRPVEWLEARVAGLPPYGALALYATPAIALFPIKLLSLSWIAGGHAALGIALLVGAKVLGTAIVARLFHLTKPKLLQLGWFASLYGRWVPWKDAVVKRVHATTIWRESRNLSVDIRRAVAGWVAAFRRRR